MSTSQHKSLWRNMTQAPSFPSLKGTLQVDVIVLGAGITGVTAAWHLASAGKKVALLDMNDIGSGETGKTTSHLTSLMDGGTAELRKTLGDVAAAQTMAAQREAIEFIEARSRELAPPCRFRRVPGYIYSEDAQGVDQVDAEVEALRALGVGVERLTGAPLPFHTHAALRVEAQAQVEPMAYLSALTDDFVKRGGVVFTNSRVIHVEDGAPCRAVTAQGEVRGEKLLLATHTPPNRLAYHTQIAAYRTYALAAACAKMPPPGLYFDTADPYHYIRTQDTDEGELLIVGGCDHKTGKQEDTRSEQAALQSYAREHFSVQDVKYEWSGQIMEPADGIPFVGPNALEKNTLFASGYSGNGITLGTAAGKLLCDLALGRTNPYQQLFSSRRLDILAQGGSIIAENIDIPQHLVADHMAALASIEAQPSAGEGMVGRQGAHAVAKYCDDAGKQHVMSAVCPHLGCIVHWNNGEKSWDCPCHGSRFSATGKLLNGPALSDLKPLEG